MPKVEYFAQLIRASPQRVAEAEASLFTVVQGPARRSAICDPRSAVSSQQLFGPLLGGQFHQIVDHFHEFFLASRQ